MQVNSVSNTNNSPYKSNQLNFKQGLTREIVTHVKNMPPDEYTRITERLQNKYGLRAEVGCSNAVAFCVEQTANIIDRAGFDLTKVFSFKSLKGKHFGEYFCNDEIAINSRHSEFLDLEQLNQLEEKNYSYNCSKHFLNSFIHEFLHGGHYKNIVKQNGKDKGHEIFWGELTYDRTYYTLRMPLFRFVDSFFPKLTYDERENIFPERLELLRTEDLAEYFTERNSLKLATQLGDSFNIDNVEQNMAQKYKGFPDNWNINDIISFIKRSIQGVSDPSERNKIITAELTGILNCFEGEIWNGNLKVITEKSHAFENCGKNLPK